MWQHGSGLLTPCGQKYAYSRRRIVIVLSLTAVGRRLQLGVIRWAPRHVITVTTDHSDHTIRRAT